jgi:hypothetical protein
MNGPADTLGYMVAAYAIIFVVLLIYLASLFIRWKNLRQDEETFSELEKKESTSGAVKEANGIGKENVTRYTG